MKAMIFAAGLGTRLRPLTDHMPKALVPVGGKPMLEHVINRLKEAGFQELIINIHHFGNQIIDFLNANQQFGLTIHISDEREALLDTGGGILKASAFFENDEPVLIHNVDILSNVDLAAVYAAHCTSNNHATLVASERKTARYFVFDTQDHLRGWMNIETEQYKPASFLFDERLHHLLAFSGIHVISPHLIPLMRLPHWSEKFSITDFYLHICQETTICAYPVKNLQLIDIGKPNTLAQAETFLTHF